MNFANRLAALLCLFSGVLLSGLLSDLGLELSFNLGHKKMKNETKTIDFSACEATFRKMS